MVEFPEPGTSTLADTIYRMAQQGFLNVVTGRLDSDAPPRRPQPSPGPVVLPLAEETPGERQRRLYREAGVPGVIIRR